MSSDRDLSEADFALLMSQIAPRGVQTKQPLTLEEAIAGDAGKLDQSIQPRSVGETLPVPDQNMSLGKLAELMGKYKAVVERGAYLAVWTDMKATPNESMNAEEEARRHMTDDEMKAYDWFKQNGNQDEFEWSRCREEGETPPKKQREFHQQLLALRVMYKSDAIDERNLYWIRKNKPAHFKIVLAYTKVFKAANDLRQACTSGELIDYKEYQTCKKIIGEAGQRVNDALKEIRELTNRIDEATQLVIARRLIVGRRCGIDVNKEGSAVRGARELGRTMPGLVTAPGDKPKGKRTLRETMATMEELRNMTIDKNTTQYGLASHGVVPVQGAPHKRARGADAGQFFEIAIDTGLNEASTRDLVNKINRNQVSEELKQVIKGLIPADTNNIAFRALHAEVGLGGIYQIPESDTLTLTGRVVRACANRLIRSNDEWRELLRRGADNGVLQDFMIASGGFMGLHDNIDEERRKLKEAAAGVGGSGGGKPSGSAGPSGEAMVD
jgi:hypothetical protein